MGTAPIVEATRDPHPGQGLKLALGLSLAAAVSLGITRFAYGLLLPPMREDLGWSYALAGSMNTSNAVGYLLGALSTPWLLRRIGPGHLMALGALLASLFMAGSGFFDQATPLMVQRLMAGLASGWVFIAGGLLATRLGALWPDKMGWMLGLYYAGPGMGIVLSSVSVPVALSLSEGQTHAWRWAWWALALACVLATWVLLGVAKGLKGLGIQTGPEPRKALESGSAEALPNSSWSVLKRFTPALLSYSLFGVGYIGYMTFVIALLRQEGASVPAITVFYTLLGTGVMLSSRVWAGLLDRHKNGQPMARLNALLAVATLLPALSSSWTLVLVSGVLFGGVFLSVVASTTALVRHNLPPEHWSLGITAFTTVFALGQIVGPTMVGWIADGPGGLARGLMFSAGALWVGALLALGQRQLD